MTYRLPPLNCLRLFEAAARHQSFKKAAAELRVTSGAVSHGIRTLEEWLGVRLFLRTGRGMNLTGAGLKYLPSVRSGLEMLSSAAGKIPGRPSGNRLSISAPPTFATRIILPRLSAFSSLHPSMRVTITTERRHVEFPRDGVDIAIRMGRHAWPGFSCTRLSNETLVPVCSPKLKASLGATVPPFGAPLVHLTSASEDWETWSKKADVSVLETRPGIKVDTIQLALDAASEGLGIALGRRPIVDPDIECGRLVTLGLPEVESAVGYWLIFVEDDIKRAEISQFSDWIVAELRKNIARRPGAAKAVERPYRPTNRMSRRHL